MMHNMFYLALTAFVVTAATAADFPDVTGSFNGMANWFEFTTDPSKEYGSDIINYKQNTRLSFTEQEGPFFRGKEYYQDNSQPTGWKFVASLYGIMTKQADDIYSVRFSEYLNQNKTTIDNSIETIGLFTGTLHQVKHSPLTMKIDYTGGTKGMYAMFVTLTLFFLCQIYFSNTRHHVTVPSFPLPPFL